MSIRLKKLNFSSFIESRTQMFDLLDTNRTRLAPYFWWATQKMTGSKFRFYVFMSLYTMTTKYKEFAHKLNPVKTYDEQFFVYNEQGKIGGMCGLDNIDTQNAKNAEIWGLAFKGNSQTIESVKILEDYCINNLGLNSIYGKVQSSNRASRYFWEKYGYDDVKIDKDVQVSKHNPTITDMYTYTKFLCR